MNTSSWRSYYESNRQNRLEPDWDAPCTVSSNVQREMAISLSHFQLGETGGGSHLLNEAQIVGTDADDLAALTLFVDEEREHARLLALMVRRLGGELISRHWSHRLFKLARRAGGFRFEIQMLVTAEIIGTAYYEMVHARCNDPAIEAATGLMLRDEAQHVAFHQARQRTRWLDYFPLERAIWALQFEVLGRAAVRAAWLDHGPCLRALGFTWKEFALRTRQLSIQFLDGLKSPTQVRCSSCPAEKARSTAG